MEKQGVSLYDSWSMDSANSPAAGVKGKLSTFSSKKGYKIRGEVHGKGGNILTSRLAWAPLLNQTAVPGPDCHTKRA